jgi:hypothetical protein
MNGQWVGDYAGAQPGYVRVNCDDIGTRYSAAIYLSPFDGNLPTTLLTVETADKNPSFVISMPPEGVAFVDPGTGTAMTRERSLQLYPSVTAPVLEATVSFDSDARLLKWTTNTGNSAESTLSMKGGTPSELTSTELSWEAFRPGLGFRASKSRLGQKIGSGQFVPVGVLRTRHRTRLGFRTRRFWPLRPERP